MIAYRKCEQWLVPVDQCDFGGGDSCPGAFEVFRDWNVRENGATVFLVGNYLTKSDGSRFSDVQVFREGTNLRDSKDWRRAIHMQEVS